MLNDHNAKLLCAFSFIQEKKMKHILKIGTLAFLASAILVPATANAQNWEREKTANEWRTIASISGAIGILGLLNHDDTLTFAGAAGALYSSYRFNEDLKSMDRHARLRAEYFDRDCFYRDGHRFERREVWRNGQKYYQFVNCDLENRSQGSDWFRIRERHDNDEWRRSEQRRLDEERRYEDQRRHEESRRREEERRQESRRRDEERRRDEARRKEQERWARDHRNDRNRDDRDYDRGRDKRDSRDTGRGRDSQDNRGRDSRDNRDNGRDNRRDGG